MTVCPLNTLAGSAVLAIDTSASPLAPPPSLPVAGNDPPPDTVAVLETVAGAGVLNGASTKIVG